MKEILSEVLQRKLWLVPLCAVSWLIPDALAAEASDQGSQAATGTQPSGASPILSIVFDDPNQLFASSSDGISLTDMQNNSDLRDKEVATGIGGTAKLEIGGGDRDEGSGEPPKAFAWLSNPEDGIKSALRVNGNKTVPGTSGVIRIKPEAEGNSMAAISQFKEGKIFLNGGLDIFFRYSEEPATLDLAPFIFSSQGPGIHFAIHAADQSVIAFLNDSEGQQVFDTDLDGAADADRVDTVKINSAQFEPEKFQHLGIWFQTADDGTVTMKVFFKLGAGAINTAEDVDLVSSGSFRILTDQSSKLLQHDSLAVAANSRSNPELIHNDVAAFRLFAPAPAIFPSLTGEQ
jgi:hypothetical protein